MRAVGLLLALLALVVAGCGGGSAMEENAPLPEMEAPSSDASSRQAAPPITGTTLDGDEISLADFRGRPVFVNVWSSW
jgi:hypothetical protein